jgi:hypothetical protein
MRTVTKRRPRVKRRTTVRRPARARGKPRQRLQPSRFPTHARLEELYAFLMQHPNVTGCYIGAKRRKGRLSKQLAVVCCVKTKRPHHELERGHRIPSTVTWSRTRTEQVALPTDVQEIGESGFQQLPPIVGPGDAMGGPGGSVDDARATIGIVLKHPTLGDVVTTAGHAFIRSSFGEQVPAGSDADVRIFNVGSGAPGQTFAGLAIKAVVRPEADYALLAPVGQSRNLYRDQFNLNGLHWALPDDVETSLFALTRRGLIATTLRGVAAVVELVPGVRMSGLLLTDFVTKAGDSGCALVDSTFRVWGLLAGFATTEGQRHSVFAPAHWVLTFENAQLA